MRVAVYAVRVGRAWSWRLSLDVSLATDSFYWFGRAEELVRVRGDMPLGAALLYARRPSRRPENGEGLQLAAAGAAEGDGALRLVADVAAAMSGRSLLREEFVGLLEHCGERGAERLWRPYAQRLYLEEALELAAGVEQMPTRRRRGSLKRDALACRRCGGSGDSAIVYSACASCGEPSCAYCAQCLTMGRARRCAPLLIGARDGAPDGGVANARRRIRAARTAIHPAGEPFAGQTTDTIGELWDEGATAPYIPLGDWGLSPAQAEATQAGLRFLASARTRPVHSAPSEFLIWAVTGAGKTEMMYPLVAAELLRGGRALIATPRKDVVLELLPRVRAAFPRHEVIALHGGSAHRWEAAHITIATTHQLMRFERAFDLSVIDEIDAFPYHNSPMLTFAARKACAIGGAVVLLSATPPARLQRAARRGKLAHAKVPVRYHRKPLPVPALRRYAGLDKLCRSDAAGLRRDGGFARELKASLARGAQTFVFVPRIERLAPLLLRVRRVLAGLCDGGRIDATSSQDEGRGDKVLRLRNGDIRILLTTTILERGVTIPKSDVFVMDADAGLFDAAALVQMAGRAGRSAADPAGRVFYFARDRTASQIAAIRQIRSMNRLARRKGYLTAE